MKKQTRTLVVLAALVAVCLGGYFALKGWNQAREEAEHWFRTQVRPILSPVVVDPFHPFPHLANKRLTVVLALEAIVEPVSLYEPVFSDGGDTIYVMDQVGDKNDDRNWLDEIALKQAVSDLNERERKILSLRFFQGRTQMEVASEIGISQAQVSRLEKGALVKIKKEL